MSKPPAGAQLSEDGYYWWDGFQWQPVDQSGGDGDQAGSGTEITADDVLHGVKALQTLAEAMEILGRFPESLAPWVEPIGGVIDVIEMIVNMIKAMETEERGAGYRGAAYGTVYAALGMGTPSATCSGSLMGADQDRLDQEAFDKGASEAAAAMGDAVCRNRVLVRIAKDGGDPGTTVNNIYQALCASSQDSQLAQAYATLPWPGPVCA